MATSVSVTPFHLTLARHRGTERAMHGHTGSATTYELGDSPLCRAKRMPLITTHRPIEMRGCTVNFREGPTNVQIQGIAGDQEGGHTASSQPRDRFSHIA